MRSYLRTPLLFAVLVAISLASSACSKPEPTPAEARRNRLETRLKTSFADAQSKCILGKLDEPTIAALDRTATLAPGQALDRYSEAVRDCVADPATTTKPTRTTTSTRATSTTDTSTPSTRESTTTEASNSVPSTTAG